MKTNRTSYEKYQRNTNNTNKSSTKKSRRDYHDTPFGTMPLNSYLMHQPPYRDDSYHLHKRNKQR